MLQTRSNHCMHLTAVHCSDYEYETIEQFYEEIEVTMAKLHKKEVIII